MNHTQVGSALGVIWGEKYLDIWLGCTFVVELAVEQSFLLYTNLAQEDLCQIPGLAGHSASLLKDISAKKFWGRDFFKPLTTGRKW